MESVITTSHSTTPVVQKPLKKALVLIKWPVVIFLLVTPIRLTLEFAGIPENVIFLIGLLWFTLGFSVYWGVKQYRDQSPYLIMILALAILSPISRIPVAIAWWADRHFELGTHYGLYFDNFPQALLNHVVYGSLVQLIPSFILGSIVIALMKYRKSK